MNYDYKQLHYDAEMADMGREAYTVKGYVRDGYPASSVCHGMTRIDFIESYETEAEAVKAHPELVAPDGEVCWGSAMMDRDLKDVSHIRDDSEFFAGHEDEPTIDPYDDPERLSRWD